MGTFYNGKPDQFLFSSNSQHFPLLSAHGPISILLSDCCLASWPLQSHKYRNMCQLDPTEPNKVDDNPFRRNILRRCRQSSGTHSQEQGSQGIHCSQGSSSPGSYPACVNFVIQSWSKDRKGHWSPPWVTSRFSSSIRSVGLCGYEK